MLFVSFKTDTYEARVIFYSDCKAGQLKRHIKKTFKVSGVDISKDDGGAVNVCEPNAEGDPTMYVLYVRECNDIATLVHECIHLAFRILHDRGIKIDVDNDESLAYFHNYLFKTLWNEMVIYNDKKNKGKIK